MAQQTIDIGASANDGTGDPLRDAFDKCNDNFTELYTGLVGLLDFKGATDCSANPNYPAASKGDFYVVSVAGKIGGASGTVVEIGDAYFATADNAGGTQAAVGTSWTIIQGNVLSGSSGIAIDDEGVAEATGVIKLNFVGSGVAAVDQGGGEVEVTIPGGISTFALGDATDVDTTGASAGKTLTHDGSGWVAQGFRGALVKKSADQTGANYTSSTAIAWDGEIYDTSSFHDNSSFNTRLTVPAGVNYVEVFGNLRVASLTVDMWLTIFILKNGSSSFDGACGQLVEAGIAGYSTHFASGPIPVTAGDYFEMALQCETDTTIDVIAARSNFGIKVVG